MLAATLALLLSGPAQTEGVGAIELTPTLIDISGADHKLTLPCNGRKVVIAGSGHVVRLTGECASLDLSGGGNNVTVTLRPGALLEIAGSDHVVRWSSKGDVKRDLSGAGHNVVRVK